MASHQAEVELPAIQSLGTHYSSVTTIEAQVDSGVVRLISRPVSATRLFVSTALTVVVLGGFFSLCWQQAKAQMGIIFVPIFIATGVLAVFGPIVMAYVYNSSCSQVNPLLEVDLGQGLVRIRNGQKVFPVSSVHSLVGASVMVSEGSHFSELQLMIRCDNAVAAELLCTKYDSSPRRSFGKALARISQECPFPVLISEPTGFLRRGPTAVTKV